MNGIKRCPSCGIDNVKFINTTGNGLKHRFYIRCGWCEFMGPKSIFKSIAIWRWNHIKLGKDGLFHG